MIRTIGCLSYVPLGYGTPQIQYLLRNLAAFYRINTPVSVFTPRFDSYPDRDELFPDFSIHHYYPVYEHRSAIQDIIPDLLAYIRKGRFSKIGIYGAGTHTRALLELWEKNAGPGIATLITSEPPPEPTFQGLPITTVGELKRNHLDFVVLSSQSFEREMAERLRLLRPELPFAALYDASLSHFPAHLPPPALLKPRAFDENRTEAAVRWLEAVRPDLVVCTHLSYFKALIRSRHRPRHLIYYVLELPQGSDGLPLLSRHWREHAALKANMDLLLFPERERMRYYLEVFQWKDVPACLIYNSRPLAASEPLPATRRNGRVIIQGSLRADLNFIKYLAERDRARPHIDVYGFLQDHDPARAILLDRESAKRNGYTYRGFVDNETVSQRRRQYAFSFVSWNPTTFDTLHACPNKFFESIADGVPPIAAPHPQCREIIEKFDCGILLKDWSLEAFLEGLDTARRIYGTRRYRQLVANCRHAHETELCWEKQFNRIRRRLPRATPPSRAGKRPRLVLLDPTLRDEVGHHYHYARHVLDGARRLGFETVIATNRALEVHIPEADRLHPVYWYDFWGRNISIPGKPVAADASAHFVETTRRLLAAETLGPNDEVFVPNISDTDLAALSDWLLALPEGKSPRWHLFIRHDLPKTGGTSRITSMQALGGGRSRVPVTFYTDTAELAAQHESATGVPVTVLPIPVSAEPLRKPRKRSRRPWRVTYLGDARTEKGYPLLPAIVRECADLITSGILSFHIQTVGSHLDSACEEATRTLKALQLGPGLNLYDKRLSTADYMELLYRADVILALYAEGAYSRRSSHVVVEGLCCGKVVLTRRGSAPGALLPDDCPWLCSNVADAVRALRHIAAAERPSEAWKPADRLRRRLAAFHNGWRLAEILTGREAAVPAKQRP